MPPEAPECPTPERKMAEAEQVAFSTNLFTDLSKGC